MARQSTIKPQDIYGLDSDLSLVSGSPQERFFQKLIDYFKQWSSANATSITAGQIPRNRALLMLFSESPTLEPGIPEPLIVSRTPVFETLYTLDDGVAVAGESLSEVIHLVPSFSHGANEAMAFVQQHLKADQSFALLMFGQSRMLVHDSGVSIEEWAHKQRVIEIKQIPNASITPQIIDQQLDEFYNDALSTHRGTIARLMWQIREEPLLSLLGHKPELHVQSGLLTYFRGIYREKVAVVDEEVSLNEGRVDVRLVRFDHTNKRLVTMIELKVLAPQETDPVNLAWAHEGIEQAHKYKRSNFTDAAFACIYDARRSKVDTMPSLKQDADTKEVVLKLYPMPVPPPRKKKKAPSDAGTKTSKASVVRSPAKKAANGAAKKRIVSKRTRKAA